MVRVRRLSILLLVVLLLLLIAASAALAAQPTRVLIFTFDQMRPEYAEQYDMDNILWLQKRGADFTRAYTGQMASETVVQHNTIVSGLLPKHMGWSDEVLRDVDGVLGYEAGAIVTTGELSYDQYVALIEAKGYPKLGDYMHEAYPGTVVANFGEKGYQVLTLAASSSDYWVTFSGKKAVADLPAGTLPWTGKYRMPDGNVPDYILDDDRYKISSGNATDIYGTNLAWPAWLYPEDGRYAPGPYPDHRSGDEWVADAAMEVMENEDWSAIHINFSGIDKIGHMWGGGVVDALETYQWDPSTLFNEIHMPFQAKNADEQLGRIIAKLKELGQWKETLVVVLADHGQTYGENAYYVDAYDGGTQSWYYDPNEICANTAYGRLGYNNPALAPLNVNDNLAYSYQSTAIEAWLIDQSWEMKEETADAMEGMPGVIATYIRDGDEYVLVSTGEMTAAERSWWNRHGQELVDTMAFEGAADVVGLLGDRTCYGVYGDHGGAQKDVQRIPMVMWAKGMKHMTSKAPFRLVDVMPTVLKAMGIEETAPMDGIAYDLPIKP
jgi:hypothetical protein